MTILAPDVSAVTALLTNNFSAGNALTVWAHAVLNTALQPLDPKPTWFDALDAQLRTTQTPASQWVNADGPAVAAGVPQGFIDYGDTFTNAANDLPPVVAQALANPGRTPDAQQRADLLAVLGRLTEIATKQRDAAAGFQQTISAFTEQVAAVRDQLTTDIENVSRTIQSDQDEVFRLNAHIASIQAQLATTTLTAQNAEQAAAKTGAQLVFTLFTFVVSAAVTGGASAPVMGIAGGVLGAGSDIFSAVKNDRQILADLQAIGDLQAQIDAEDFQLTALNGILANLRRLKDNNEAASGRAADIAYLWDDILDQLAGVTEVLAQPALDLGLVSALNNLPAAADAWQTIITRATNVQNSSLEQFQNITLTVPPAQAG